MTKLSYETNLTNLVQKSALAKPFLFLSGTFTGPLVRPEMPIANSKLNSQT